MSTGTVWVVLPVDGGPPGALPTSPTLVGASPLVVQDALEVSLENLRENLAAIEHERWADWQAWMHDRIREHGPASKGDYMLVPGELFRRWERQIATPYDELTFDEQESDRKQVDRYWPLIEQWLRPDPDFGPCNVIACDLAATRRRDALSYCGEHAKGAGWAIDPRALVDQALAHAYAKHGREPWGRHEFYGILMEEVEEMWDEIKADAPTERVLAEVIQIACVCLRYLETGDRYLGPHDLSQSG